MSKNEPSNGRIKSTFVILLKQLRFYNTFKKIV
jgi:hypothetical protein